jgi:hypothetical protein
LPVLRTHFAGSLLRCLPVLERQNFVLTERGVGERNHRQGRKGKTRQRRVVNISDNLARGSSRIASFRPSRLTAPGISPRAAAEIANALYADE